MCMPVIVVMVIMRMVVAMMVIMCVIVIMMMSVLMVVIMLMPMMVSMVVSVAVLMAMTVLMAVAQIVLQIVFIVGLRRGLGRAGASAAGFRLGRFLIGRVGLGGLRALHLVSGQGSGFRFTLVMPAAMCMIVVMMMTMVVLMRMLMMMPMSMGVSMVVAVLVPVVVLVLVPMVVSMVVSMVMSMVMSVVMSVPVVMSASTAMLAQALVVELVRHLQPLLIQQRQRASTVAGCCAGRLDLLCRYAFSQQGQPLVEITMANAVDHQTRAGRCQRQRQSQLNQKVGRIAHQFFGLLGQHHQLGCVRQVETHRHMAGCHMMEPVGVGCGRHGLQPNANATAASRGALRRLTACSPVRGLQQQAAGGCQGQQGLENTC